MPSLREWTLARDGERRNAAGQKQTIERLVEGALSQTGYHTLRSVVCEFDCGKLVLRGRVSSYYLKQVASTAVSKVEGIVAVDNQLEVR